MDFHFLFTRRFILSINSEALIFYPGGYGTLNELYEYIVLMQINMVDRVPIICVNREFWQGMFEWINQQPTEHGLLNYSLDNSSFLFLVDSTEEIIDIVKSVMDNGTGKAETANEHILIKLMQLRNTPMTSFEFNQERVDFHYNNWKNQTKDS